MWRIFGAQLAHILLGRIFGAYVAPIVAPIVSWRIFGDMWRLWWRLLWRLCYRGAYLAHTCRIAGAYLAPIVAPAGYGKKRVAGYARYKKLASRLASAKHRRRSLPPGSPPGLPIGLPGCLRQSSEPKLASRAASQTPLGLGCLRYYLGTHLVLRIRQVMLRVAAHAPANAPLTIRRAL